MAGLAGHAIGDKVCLLDWDFGRRGADFSDDGHNVSKYYKVVPQGADVIAKTAVGPIMRTSRPMWTFSPTYLRADRDASNNLTLKWVRRTQAYFVLFSPTGAPLAADGEKYELNLYRTSDNSLRRTVIVSGATTCAYTHDSLLLQDALEQVVVEPPDPLTGPTQHLCLDTAFSGAPSDATARVFGYEPHVRRIGEEKRDPASGRKKHPARRWVVERTIGWLNRCRGILVRYEKKAENDLAAVQLACALLWYRRLQRLTT